MKRPVIAISTGCPASIGPETSVLAASKIRDARCLLVGDIDVLRAAAALRGVSPSRLVPVDDASTMQKLPKNDIAVWAASAKVGERVRFGKPTRACGAAQLSYVDEALRLVTSGTAVALTTAAVSKEMIATSGAPGSRGFAGHTEYLAAKLGAPEVVMAFWSERLVTSLVTTHLPLRRVPRAIDAKGVARATFWLTRLLADLGVARPRVVVAALNPHAGEGGLLGDDEVVTIEPGIALAKVRLRKSRLSASIVGPMGAESAYRRTLAGDFDGVVAMYHDQATIPMKVLSFGDAVNVSLGLPIVRTSVDHGTAYDVAGRKVADASAMIAALGLAARLAAPSGRGAPSATASRARS